MPSPTVRSIDKLRSRWLVQPDRPMFAKLNLTRRNDGNTQANLPGFREQKTRFIPESPVSAVVSHENQCKEPESSALEILTRLIQWAKRHAKFSTANVFLNVQYFDWAVFFLKFIKRST